MFSASALPALACRRHHRRAYVSQSRYRRVAYNRYYARRPYYAYSTRRSFWQRHRDALTLAIGTGGGTGVGALLGGRRGAGSALLLDWVVRRCTRISCAIDIVATSSDACPASAG